MLAPVFRRYVTIAAAVTVLPSALLARSQQLRPTSGQSTATAGAAFTGHYRNLLSEQGHSDSDIQKRLDETYAQLFHGDPATQSVYYAAGVNGNGPLAYVADVAHHDVRSEGMSYGMMISVEMNHKAEFDAIWNWANVHMLITDPANPSVGYFAWSMHTDGTPNSDSPAPDGEEYFVMSLYFAANRWGNGTGLYDYKFQADRLLRLMRHHGVRTGTGPFRIHPQDPPFAPAWHNPVKAGEVTVGPMVDEQHRMICFVPGSGGNSFTDPSYHLPAFYELWALWGPEEDRAFWAEAARASRQFFTKATNPATALSPDYARFDGTPQATGFNPMSSTFSYDSWRTVSDWSVDQSWWGSDPNAKSLSDRLQKFLYSQGMQTFADRYTLDGKPLSDRHSTGMVATTAVGGLATGATPEAKAFVEALWNTAVPSGEQRYFDGMLYMLSLLHASGHFRIWGSTSAISVKAGDGAR